MSRLSWNEIRTRAHAFAREYENASYEKGETQTFYNDFFEIFGVSRRRVASFEEPIKKLGNKQGFIDLFWKGVLLVEQKSAGRSLTSAKEQAFGYFPGIKETDLPRYVLACDFQNFELHDLEEGDELKFKLKDLHLHIDKFGFILGVQKRAFKDQDPVNLKASTLMGRLHDALYHSGYRGHSLERFLVRLLFCLFADDTGIFEPRDIFDELIRTRTKEDGSDVGSWLTMLFQTLDTLEEERESALDEDLARFPYINGDLFKENLRLPSFDGKMRSLLLEACEFSWDAISPAIFGALFQHVSGDAAARRAHGEHYTTENHIMRVIGPLFVDELTDELQAVKKKKGAAKDKELKAYCEKLAKLKFFDPACGCGNFLIIAYREIRLLETEALIELYKDKTKVLDIDHLSGVDVNQFYGIEIKEFPVRIAEVAMWMMDHIMNNRLGLALTQNFARIPLKKSPNIFHGDALETDWASICTPTNETYIFGNPPFLGAKVQNDEQRMQVRRIANLGKSGGTLDYVCAWYLKAGDFVSGTTAKFAFVSTNSITQGEQLAQLWPRLFRDYSLEIAYGHRTFEWSSDAKGKAHVHCVIIGLVPRHIEPKTKRLFSYPNIRGEAIESTVEKLSPYLIDGSQLNNPHIVVKETSRPINGLPAAVIGSKAIDDENLIFSEMEAHAFLKEFPHFSPYLRPLLGSEEFINNKKRFILALHNCPPEIIKANSEITDRLKRVTKFRLESKSPPTQKLAKTPTLYHVNVLPKSPFLVLPQTSSETREYMPIGFAFPPMVPTNAVKVVQNAELFHFAVLTSKMHMSWMKTITGRLKSDFQYSIGVVYNNFPMPITSDAQRSRIEQMGQAVVEARASHPNSTLADLYDPVTMPANLRKAHSVLDAAVDKLYRPSGFNSDADRVVHLLNLYEQMTSLFAESPKAHKRRPRASPGIDTIADTAN